MACQKGETPVVESLMARGASMAIADTAGYVDIGLWVDVCHHCRRERGTKRKRDEEKEGKTCDREPYDPISLTQIRVYP